MTEETPVLLSIESGIAKITLNRPDRLNAITVDLHAALIEAIDHIEADDSVRVMILTGAGRGFCAGQDLAERKVEDDAPLDLGYNVHTYYNPLVRRLKALRFPWIAAVNGVAAGAGASIALLADIVIATESARFNLSFVKIGLIPDSGGTWTLPHLVGQARARGVAMLGQPVPAVDAAAWGMIWKAVPDDEFLSEVAATATALAAAPTTAVMAVRDAIDDAWARSLDEQLDHERDQQRKMGLTEDYREGVRAFKAKRAPQFRGL